MKAISKNFSRLKKWWNSEPGVYEPLFNRMPQLVPNQKLLPAGKIHDKEDLKRQLSIEERFPLPFVAIMAALFVLMVGCVAMAGVWFWLING